MRILRIRVENVRGIDACEVRLAEDGVTVVEAPNESGKTTLVEAVGLLLERKDSSNAKDVRDLAPAGRDVGSLVEVELRCGEHHLTCRKRFNRRTMTELEVHAPRREQLAGDEAHDRLRTILEAEVDLALFSALWFRQGRALDSVELGGSSALRTALDASADGGGGVADDALLDRARAEFGRWFTPKGGDGKALREVDEALAAAEEEVGTLERRLRAVEADVEELARLEETLAALTAQVEELDPQLEEHRRRRAEIGELRARVGSRRAEADAARLRSEAAEADRRARQNLIESAAALEAESVTLEEELAPEESALAELEERLAEASEAARSAEEQVREAREVARTEQDAADLAALREEQARLAGRQERVEAILAEVAEAEALLEGARLDDRLLGEIRDAAADLRAAQAALSAGAPTVDVRATQDVAVTADGDTSALAAGATTRFTVEDELVLDVEGTVGIAVRAGTSIADLRAAVEDASRRLADACDAAGVADLDAADALMSRLARAREKVERGREDLAVALDGLDRNELDDRAKVAAVRADEIASRLGDQAAEPDAQVGRHRLDVARKSEAAAVERAEAARSERERLREETGRARESLTRQQAHAEGRREESHRASDRLAEARAAEDDDAVEARAAAAATALAEAEGSLAEAEEALAALDPDTVEMLAENAEKTRDRLDRERREAEDRRLALRTRLDVAGEDGLGEQLESARVALEHARSTRERTRGRAEAARLLLEALTDARDEAYRSYRKPLRDGIVRLGRIVFGPSLDVTLDDDLTVVERTLDGTSLPWEALSSGAREQLAVVTALAATQLAAAGGVPLILDDTLGYTDPGRLERLGAVLGAVDGCQVVVLTCVGDRFRHIGGAEVVAMRRSTPA